MMFTVLFIAMKRRAFHLPIQASMSDRWETIISISFVKCPLPPTQNCLFKALLKDLSAVGVINGRKQTNQVLLPRILNFFSHIDVHSSCKFGKI